MYELVFDKSALREFAKLEKNVQKRIWDKLQECKDEPFRFLKPLIEIKGFKLSDLG